MTQREYDDARTDKFGIINTFKRKSRRRNVANLMDNYNGAFILSKHLSRRSEMSDGRMESS